MGKADQKPEISQYLGVYYVVFLVLLFPDNIFNLQKTPDFS